MFSLRRPFNPSGMVVYLTDFGLADDYVGQMHLNLLRLAPGVRPIDLCHTVPPGDIRSAAFLLKHDAGRLPDGAVVVCVVDPGVGTSREIIALQSERNVFMAPDNGLLSPLRRTFTSSNLYRATLKGSSDPSISRTFHGRDLFTPLAADLAVNPMSLAEKFEAIDTLEDCCIDPEASGSDLKAEVMWIDRFGNLVTNLPAADMRKRSVYVNDRSLRRVQTFSEGREGEFVWLEGSRGTVEIVINSASAADISGLSLHDTLLVTGGAG
ncbi:hypothetical protein GF324_06620 [bacterium]|nr:hypothetical protein [bacterium]